MRAYITALRSNGAVVRTAIVMNCAERIQIIKNHDSNLLTSIGGHILLIKGILRRVGFMKRRASTKAKYR